jgi:hypothetical protein
VRAHAWGIAFVLVLAAMLVMPRWWLLFTSPGEGERVQASVWGASGIGLDEALYGSMVRDAYDGDLPIRDPFFADPSRSSPQTGSLWNIVIGALGGVFGDTAEAMAVVTTLAAVIAFLLYYALAYRLTGSRLAAVSAIGISLPILYALNRSPGFLALRRWDVLRPLLTLDPQRELHIWTRYLAPAIPLPVFLALLLCLPAAVRGRRVAMAASGALLALLIYTYLFYWFAAALALALWAVWLAFAGERRAALNVLAVVAVAVVLASPELALVAWNGATLPDDVQARVGAYGGLALNTAWLRAILQRVVLGAPFAWFGLKGPRINRLYVALYIAPLIPASTTGWLPQTDHFLFQAWPVFSIPLFVSGAVEAAKRLRPETRRAAVLAIAVLGALGSLHFAAVQVRGVRAIDGAYGMPSGERAAFRWMDENLDRNDTVVTPSWITNQLVAVMTPASTYLADGFVTRVSDKELLDRYLRVSAAYGINENAVFYRVDPARDVPTSDRTIATAELERYFDDAIAYYLFNEGIRRASQIRALTGPRRPAYRRLLGEPSVLATYDADYLFCGHRERFWRSEGAAPGLWVQVAFQAEGITVYRLVAEGTAGAVEFRGC